MPYPPLSHCKTSTFSISDAPIFRSAEKEEFAWPGQSRDFTCKADAVPRADLTWFRRGEFIRNSDIYTVKGKRGTSTLTVSHHKFFTRLYCNIPD